VTKLRSGQRCMGYAFFTSSHRSPWSVRIAFSVLLFFGATSLAIYHPAEAIERYQQQTPTVEQLFGHSKCFNPATKASEEVCLPEFDEDIKKCEETYKKCVDAVDLENWESLGSSQFIVCRHRKRRCESTAKETARGCLQAIAAQFCWCVFNPSPGDIDAEKDFKACIRQFMGENSDYPTHRPLHDPKFLGQDYEYLHNLCQRFAMSCPI